MTSEQTSGEPHALVQNFSSDDSSHLNRRLAAIVFADVAGYSRLMALQETETVRRWKRLRSEIMEPLVHQHRGRIAERAGDALLIEFPSAVIAVRWAIDVQRAVQGWRAQQGTQALMLRIGINVEDIIEDDGILQGDGVIIAARIHQSAEPGQIVVTAAVHDYVTSRLPVTFRDMGTPILKNIDREVRVFAVDWEDTPAGNPAIQPYLQWSTRQQWPFSHSETLVGEGKTPILERELRRTS